MRAHRPSTLAALALAFALGCSGSIRAGGGQEANEGPAGPVADTPPGKSPDVSPAATPSTPAVCARGAATAPMRRLTRREYDNTVRDLLGTTLRPAAAFELDDLFAGFEANAVAAPTRVAVERYAEAAEVLAAAVDVAKLVPCAPAAGDAACARKFVEGFGRRAYRRALETTEIDELVALFAEKRARSDFAGGVRLVLQAMLQSPAFLYRPTIALADPKTVPAAYERAARLSYLVWASGPDEALLRAAETGALATRAGVEAEVKRLLADSRGLEGLRSFEAQWLDLPRLDAANKDASLYPEFGAALKASMRREAELFLDDVLTKRGGSLTALLTATDGFVDAGLAKLYGVAAPAAGFSRAELPGGQRAGVLTQAGVLSAHALAVEGSPILRGLFVRERLLCQTVNAPPDGVEIVPPKLDPNLTTKQRFEQHRQAPACAGCHELMDPIGFGFSHYDAIGRWRTMDGRFTVDAAGELRGTRDADGPFDGAPELARRLATSSDVPRCAAELLLRFALARRLGDDEGCLLDAAARRFAGAKLDLRELVVAVATSDLVAGPLPEGAKP